VAQLFPRALGSLYVASYDSQGCGGGVLTRLHMGRFLAAEQSYVTTDGQSVNKSWCRAHSGLVTRHISRPKVSIGKFVSCLRGETSLTRGRVDFWYSNTLAYKTPGHLLV
jgi:hypothetical protein